VWLGNFQRGAGSDLCDSHACYGTAFAGGPSVAMRETQHLRARRVLRGRRQPWRRAGLQQRVWTLDDDRTCAYGASSLFDAACVQAPFERGAGRDADVRGSPRLPNSPSHQALHRPRPKEVAREAITHQKGPRVSGALPHACRELRRRWAAADDGNEVLPLLPCATSSAARVIRAAARR
jgi:hypothetical protein